MDWIVSGVVLVSALGETWPRDLQGWLQLGFTVVNGVLLLGRRRWPVPVTAAVALVSVVTFAVCGISETGNLALAFACYAVAASRPPTVAWLTVTGALSAYSAAVLLWQRTTGSITYSYSGSEVSSVGAASAGKALSIFFALLVTIIALAIGASVRSRRLHVADLLDRANSLARERDQEGQIAAARERTRIAREMHDVVAHSLTVMITLADGAKATPDRELATAALDELTETGRSALTDMRRVLGVLRDDDDAAPLAPHDPDETLEQIIEPFRRAGLPVRIVRTGPAVTLPSNVRHAAHRIVSEALTNVLRYAPLAPVVEVRVRERHDQDGAWLELRVFNIAGPAVADRRAPMGSGHGIIGMKERAAMYGGTATAGPTATGWEVAASLRLPEADGPLDETGERAKAWPW